MSLRRRLLQSDRARALLCALAALHIRLVRWTGRWRVLGGDIPRRFWDEGRPFILCFWHGRLLMMPYCWERRVPIRMLISPHRDGQLIARTVAHFGIETVVGSTARGGSAALRTMVRALKEGACVGITPDGPHGPLMRASVGVANLARLSGAAVIPATFSARPRRLLSTWDRFVLALPFGRGVFAWGDPIFVPPDADESALEQARLEIERRLNALTAEADALLGLAPVELAAPGAAPRKVRAARQDAARDEAPGEPAAKRAAGGLR